TAGGKGCTKIGVCGKTPEIAALQDLLIYQVKGISCYVNELIKKGEKIDKDIVSFVENSLFTTLTNVNFDGDVHEKMLKESQEIKQNLRSNVSTCENCCEQATYNLSDTRNQMLEDAKHAGIMYDQNLD
ncbi:hydroxylamine reductase, partial [Clostridium tertium]